MSSLIKRFIKKFDPKQVTQDAKIEYLTTAGFFGDQVDALDNISGDDIIDQSAKFSKALIPYLNTRKDNQMRKLLKCYLENYEIYQSLIELITKHKKKVGDKELLGELIFTKGIMQPMMESDGKMILSLTFSKLDPKTLVLDKPYIIGKGYGGPDSKKDTLFSVKKDE